MEGDPTSLPPLSPEGYCNSCLAKSDERPLHVYTVRNESLRTVLKLDRLLLCFVCKRVAQQSENFIRNVEKIQPLLDNVSDLIVLGNLKSDVRPLVNLSTLLPKDEDIIKLSGKDPIMYVEGGGLMKVEVEVPSHDNNMSIKKELEAQAEVEEYHAYNQMYHTTIEYESSSSSDSSSSESEYEEPKKKRGPKQESFIKQAKIKGLNLKIHTFSLTKEQCLAELAQMATDTKYIEAPYRCTDCVKWFMMKETYEKHLDLHKPVTGKYECDICKRRWPTNKQLNMHVARHTVRFKCPKCEYTKKCRNMVKDHYLAKHLEGHYQYTCKICNKQYKCRLSLKKHIEDFHFKKDKIKCKFCDKMYKTKDSLRSHLITHHTEQVQTKVFKRYKCEECGRLFGNPSLLRNHSFTHNDIRNFYCVECDKRFATKNRLQAHLKTYIHTQYKQLPFVCSHCGKGFRIQRNLDQHVNGVHLKIRQFQCDVCGKEYAGRRQLVLHIHTVHKGFDLPRHFPCSVCQKRFHDNRRLEAHMRTHTGEKPFKCPQCPAVFSQSGSLYNHNKLVHLKLTRKGTPKGERPSTNTFRNIAPRNEQSLNVTPVNTPLLLVQTMPQSLMTSPLTQASPLQQMTSPLQQTTK